MIQHNSVSLTHFRGAAMKGATQFDRNDLAEAFKGMSTGITRPQSIRWRIDDAVKGKPFRPLGSYPEVAEAIADAGGSFFHLTRPLTVMLAHLRRRCSSKMPKDMKQALITVKKESDEAEAMALSLAFSGDLPSVSALISFNREACEAELALAKAREIVEDRIAELEGK